MQTPELHKYILDLSKNGNGNEFKCIPTFITGELLNQQYKKITLPNRLSTHSVHADDGIYLVHHSVGIPIEPIYLNGDYLNILIIDPIIGYTLTQHSLKGAKNKCDLTSMPYYTTPISINKLLEIEPIEFHGEFVKYYTQSLIFGDRSSLNVPSVARIEIIIHSTDMYIKSCVVFIPGSELVLINKDFIRRFTLEESKSLLTFVEDGEYVKEPMIL